MEGDPVEGCPFFGEAGTVLPSLGNWVKNPEEIWAHHSEQASLVARVKNPPAMQETWVWSLGWDDSLEKEIANPLRLFSPGKSHGQRNLVPTVHGVSKESNTTLRLNNSNSEQDLESWGSWKCHRGDFFIWEQLMGYGLMSQVCQFLRQRAFKRMPFKRMRWSHTLEFLLSILSKESKLKKKNTKTSW